MDKCIFSKTCFESYLIILFSVVNPTSFIITIAPFVKTTNNILTFCLACKYYEYSGLFAIFKNIGILIRSQTAFRIICANNLGGS